MKRVITYARASTAHQVDSVHDQQIITRKYISDKGHELIAELSDIGSGRTVRKRLGYVALKKMIAERRCDIVLVHDVSRLSRNLRQLLTIFEFAKQREIQIYAVNIGEIGQFHITALGMVAQMQIEVGAEQIKRAHHSNILEGLRAGRSLYGYRSVLKDGKRGYLVQEPKEAEIVKRAFELAADGLSLTEITGIFNAENIPGPGGGKWRSPALSRITVDSGERDWNASKSSRDARPTNSRRKDVRVGILHNTAYYGVNTFGRTRQYKDVDSEVLLVQVNDKENWLVFPGHHKPIITRELFDKVQAIRADFASKNVKIGGGPSRLLTGLIRCESCGNSMIRMGRGRDTSTTRIICTNAVFKQGCGNGRTYYVDRIEALTVRLLTTFLAGDTQSVQLFLDQHAAERRSVARLTRSGIEKLKACVDEGRGGIRNLIEALKRGGDPAILNPEISKLNREISRNEALLIEALQSGVVYKVDHATLESLRKDLQRLGARLMAPDPAPEDRETIARFRALIDRVVPISPGKWKNGFTIEVYGKLSQIVSESLDPVILGSSMLQSLDPFQMENARILVHAKSSNLSVLLGRARSAIHNNMGALGIQDAVRGIVGSAEHPQDMSQIIERLDQMGLTRDVGISSQRFALHVGGTANLIYFKGSGYWPKDKPYAALGYDPSLSNTFSMPSRNRLKLKQGPFEKDAVVEIRRLIIRNRSPLKMLEIIGALRKSGLFEHLHDPFEGMPSFMRRNRFTFICIAPGRYWPADLDNEAYAYKAQFQSQRGTKSTRFYMDLLSFEQAVSKVFETVPESIETAELHIALSENGYRRKSSKSLKQRAELTGLLRQSEDGRWWHTPPASLPGDAAALGPMVQVAMEAAPG